MTGETANGVSFIRTGDDPSLIVLNGGQGFVRRATPERLARDAAQVGRMLPSERPFALLNYPLIAPSSIDDVVDGMAAAMKDIVGARDVDLIGMSYGGMVACRLAASSPARVRRLILVASGHRFSGRGEKHVGRQIERLENGDVAGFANEFAGLFRSPWRNFLIRTAIRLARRRLAAGMAARPVAIAYLKAMLSARPAAIAAIEAPALVIGGSADQFYGDGIMEETAALMPAGKLRILSGETHMAPVEDPNAFRSAIQRFL